MGIARGTTPTHTFTTDINLENAEVLYITYQQAGNTILEKTLDDCTVSDTEIVIELSQGDTLAFDYKLPVEIQIRAKFADGSAVKSQIMTTDADRLLKEGEI